MTRELTLREVYEKAGLLKYYFDDKVPCDLYRGQSSQEQKKKLPILYPNPGFQRKDRTVRLPDVEIIDRDGKKIVKGCRTTRGDFRGISTFDRPNPSLVSFKWFRLPKDSPIPEALAITQDSDLKGKANHYTVAPKDDMTLELFQTWLNALAKYMTDAD